MVQVSHPIIKFNDVILFLGFIKNQRFLEKILMMFMYLNLTYCDSIFKRL